MMMMGPGIQGGRVIGGTTDRHTLLKINPETMALDENGTRIHPGAIHKALRQLLGIADHPVLAPFHIDKAALPLFG